ncbi:MAG TPA: hypothetical protein VH088_04645 [Terriglobales bacterium]|jgi:hypothetical protein|nr:hypothetical protein [Terriglobales bacterium]
MNRITNLSLAMAMLVGMFAVATAQTQEPLGDYARTARKDKDKDQKSAKKYDNDNLPVNDKLSIVGPAVPDAPAAGTAPGAPADAAAPATAPAPGSSLADKQKINDDWKAKIAAQKDQINLASRELDVAQREYRLRAAAMYADAGNRLRNSGTWDKEDTQYKQQIAAKQKSVDDAKKKLEDMQEQARKAGVSSSARE